MLISDAAMVSWLAAQTVGLIAQGLVTRNDIKWIKDTLVTAGLAKKEQQEKANHKAEKQTAHDTAADVLDAQLITKLEGLTQALRDHIGECKETRQELMNAVRKSVTLEQKQQ